MSPSVLVVGAGFGGLGVAIALRRAGFDDVTVLERGDDVGGVWRDNSYPNAACDVPSPLYSWSFAPNTRWGRRYSAQAEIHAYIRQTAEAEGVRDLVRTGTTVTGAAYDDEAGRWRVTTDTGEMFEADVLVPAVGQLSEPSIPAIPGTEEFTGPAFHSARWRHDVDLAGKRVAVIGTGASAIQFVPGIVDEVASITIFQRSAPYVVPKPDQAYRPLHHRVFERFPRTFALERHVTWLLSEHLNRAITGTTVMLKGLELAFRAHLRRQVKDPELRRRLRPDYPIGCKRILFSNDWYPALARPHVDLVTDRVATIEPGGVRSQDGILHEADVLIWGTGFASLDYLAPIAITGAGGRDLQETWADGARAYLGLCVPGFPNMFCVYGPNTNLGGSSIIGMLEGQADFIVDAVQAIAREHQPLEVRREVADAFDAEMQQRLGRTAWAQCDSWYREANGRITTNWPGLVQEYRDRTAAFDRTAFA